MSGKKMFTAQQSNAALSRMSLSEEELEEKIKEVAHRLYKKRGSVPGHELDDWLEAERIVKKTCS